MAEREKKNANRSVSFRKLGSWSNRSEDQQHKSEDLEAAGVALPPEPSKAEQPLATRNVSVSRKVSKISATTTTTTTTTAGLPTADSKRGSSTPLSSISPSIRQLTEKFSSSSSSSNNNNSSGGSDRTHRASPGDGAPVTRGSSTLPRARSSRREGSPSRKSFHEDSGGGYFQDSNTTTAESLTDKVQKFHSGTDSVSGSDSEKRSERRIFAQLADSSNSGKRDYSQINACTSDPKKTLTTDEEEDVTSRGVPPPCKSHRSYISPHHSDFVPPHSDKWPSVTKIRQIFDERQSKATQQHKTDTYENLKQVGRGHPDQLSPCESAPLSDRSDKLAPCSSVTEARNLPLQERCIVGAQSRESGTAKETFYYGMDFNSKADHQQYSNDEEADTESLSLSNNKVSGRNTFQSSSSIQSCTRGSHYHRINSSPYRSHCPSTEAEAACKTPRTTGLTSDPNPDLQPPATSSLSSSLSLDTSSCSSSLQQPTVRERRDRQGVGLPRDSLHSSHSSSRVQAPTSSSPFSAPAPDKAITSSSSTVAPSTELRAPARVASSVSSRWRFSSGDEEEEHIRRRRGGGGGGWSVPSGPASSISYRGGERGVTERGGSYLSRSKNGWWGAKGIGRSSGSEEDSPGYLGPPSREAVRRRSLRKKKKVSGVALATGRDDYDDHDGESEDSDSDTALTMEHLDRHHQQNTGGEFVGTASRSHSAREPSSHRARVQQWERISSPVASTTLPGVSRVSKVNIPPFVSSPGGSRCSSRYSSTETLKEEDQTGCGNRSANVFFNTSGAGGSTGRNASSSMLSKTYHGNFTMYRSPSFGHGDNFSRNPVRVRPRIVPAVTSSSSVLPREGGVSAGVRGGDTMALRRTTGGQRVDDKDKNRISMSNPDITSETMTLLSFLKSDLSELRVRKTSEGDRSGAVEGSSVYRMGSRSHGGTLLPSGRRPSLKDLTATLRRAKSFTYSDKPTTAVRCYLTAGPTKRSSSEQQLDLDGERDGGRVSVSDREVESDGGDSRVRRGQRVRGYGYDDDEVMPTPLQERYVQEARQVIRDICQMSTREDDDDDVDIRRTVDDLENECFQVKKTNEEREKAGVRVKDEVKTDQEAEFKNTKDRDKHEKERENRERERSERDGQSMQLEKLNSRGTEYRENAKRQSRETERALLKGDSEESMFYDRSVDELSGHESSLTDEGIVTEPETGPSDPSERSFLGSAGVNLGSRIARDVLGQPVTVWKQSALHEVEGFKQEREEMTENSMSCTNRLNEASVPPSLPHAACMAESDSIIMDLSTTAGMNNVNTTNEEINTNNAVSQGSTGTAGGAEAPATPSAIRRRRKFSPSGNNNTGSDSSNGSNAESTMAAVGNGESTVYRSLSDPMPQRRCSVAEEGNNNFSSVDSNLLGSLSVKGGGGGAPESSAVATLSEYKGSVASDLSVYSDGGLRDDAVSDYSGVIRSIVAEPGAMDRLMTDDHGNGKAPKKKSFSDPSRRSDAPLLSQNDPQFKGQSGSAEPISELDQLGQIPPSSSEPILSEQREELWKVESQPKHALPTQPDHYHYGNSNTKVKKPRSKSECTPNSDNHDDDDVIDQGGEQKDEEVNKFNFDLKLAEVLSPRMVRRPSRKRPNRLAQFSPLEDPFEPPEPGSDKQGDHRVSTDLTPPLPPLQSPSKPKPRSKHVRHASEPATFIPISPPPQLQPLKEGDCLAIQPSADPPCKTPADEAPSLEDVTQKYILERSALERDTEGPGPLPGTRDGTEGSVLEGPSETGTSGITEAGPQKKGTEDIPSTPIPQRTKPRVDMRRHVMMTLLDTEQSYVESLRTLIQGYMRPLKQPDSGSIVDPLLVDEMFYQIPEILEHHEHFLEQVAGCVSQWHDRQTVGHLLIQSFSKETLANMYSAYIDNFLNAKDAVRIAKEAKPAFHKFLEQNMRENKEKQALGDLMIKPVQRIPRYELLVKDLLKHTQEDHPDHSFLLDAQRDIKRLAEKINKGRRSAEEAEREARVIQEIEAHIEGVEHILNPQRKFLRQEIVMEAKTVGGKKDRSLFLFSDLIICTTLKRKSGSLRRSSMSLYSAASVIDTSSKYKFLWKLPLEDVEVVKSSAQATNKESIQKMISRLDEDLSTLGQISKLSETISFPHQSLDEAIKDLMASVHRELSEKQSLAFSMTFLPTKLEFTTVSAENTFIFEFTSPDARSNFEQAFEEAKKKLAMNKDQWDPEFLKAIPIMKTRSGMQFSCASPSHSCPDSGCEVWVCNSDGYVGQVCLLNIKDEPTVEACIAVCSARIICIAAVPGLKGRERGSESAPPPAAPGHTQQQLHISISHSSLELTEQPTGPGAELVPFDSDDTDDEDSPSPSSTLQSQASHSTISSSYGNDEAPGSKDMATETTSSEEEQEFPVASSYGAPGMLGVGGGGRAHTESPMDGRAMRRSSRGSFTRASLEDLLSIDPEAYQSSVWLGTEDGCIHVYQSSDNIRNRKNSMKIQHSASILCILYLDNKVFVSLANGEVIVYQREAGSFWDPQSSQTLVLGTPSSPVTKMVPVGGKLWCGSQNRILIINTTTLVQEHWFQVGTDSSRCVTCMVAYGQGVWLALQGSAHVKLYHAQTWESLTEVDVAPAVHKMLAGADAIIRQHKAACLRITALLACKDLLWIGTSAGVVLTLAIPAVTSGTGAGTLKSPLVPMGSAHGHTGHVRFLTSIELPEGFDMNFPPPTPDSTGNQSQSSSTVDGSLQRRDSARRRASAHLPPKNNHLVISGGDGYEDFRLTNSSETVGRDDSTNHLLLWRV
ncbi:rho guanine nucleotide exchange factor 17-like [Thunnus maccoyii]|uniref:rho guanine nucleotide exchange factor 17-like n=1 Tax=Thunnus maccoyii TaxID=8240 RepID=UPI001C4B4D11|nr:rho guanine nucleotide exchange factor 17-like [Thunnus maccoyii]XP_042269485.1 rho guanine nucleotide exchange factor 17-like [Thunnus maccoyii]